MYKILNRYAYGLNKSPLPLKYETVYLLSRHETGTYALFVLARHAAHPTHTKKLG